MNIFNEKKDDYVEEVINRLNIVSSVFLKQCRAANEKTYAAKTGLLDIDTGILNVGNKTGITKISLQTDGVGTKAEIYCHAFEGLIKKNELALERAESISDEKGISTFDFMLKVDSYDEMKEYGVDIWERMLMDLIAMNVDDFKNGEFGAIMSNIIDINAIKGPKGALFEGTFGIALNNIIEKTGIAITAGETAGMGHHPSTRRLDSLDSSIFSEILEKVNKLTEKDDINTSIQSFTDEIEGLVEGRNISRDEILETLYFNLAGSCVSVGGDVNKLTKGGIQAGDKIIALTEKPDKNGIIGPRANGLTDIRTSLIELSGEMWENKGYEEFVSGLDSDIQNKLNEAFGDKYNGLEMWKIATGSTTSFNGLIANDILGGVDGETDIELTGMVHMTGGPGIKLYDTLSGVENIKANVDMSNLQVPDIIQILQIIIGISDEEAMKRWNMGLPYILFCKPGSEDKITKIVGENSRVIGEVSEKTEEEPVVRLTGVGKNNSNIEL